MNSFSGKVAIVTGSAKGIGAEISKEFSRKGGSVVVTDVNKQNLEAIFNEMKKTNSNVE